MIIIRDFFMMTVDQRYESAISPSGIITLNTAWVNDTTVERFNYKRIYGRIEACPLDFSDDVVQLVDPGTPAPRKHISGEYIQSMVKKGYGSVYNKKFYCCAGMDDFEKITMRDIAANTDIRRFDRCYFDPRVTEPKNRLGDHNGKELYKIGVNEIICTVRDGEILMQSDWCLVKPEMETWQEITTKAGIIKKPNPQAKQLRGFMCHMQHVEGLEIGDKIIYVKGANWTIKVEGTEYYAIQKQDIICKFAA